MKPLERRDTTAKAVAKIDEYLNNRDYTSALFFSAIYAHTRLKSLLADKLARRDKEKWQVVVKELKDMRLSFYAALRMCKASGIISPEQYGDLHELGKRRNNLAHESVLWRRMERKDINDIDRLCKCARKFLQETSSMS